MFKIEDAPTNRTRCTLSKVKIVKGERRLSASLGTGNYPKQYLPKAFAEKHPNEIVELYNLVPDVYKVSAPAESYVTMEEVRETLKYILKRDPTASEMESFIYHLSKDVSEWMNSHAESFARNNLSIIARASLTSTPAETEAT